MLLLSFTSSPHSIYAEIECGELGVVSFLTIFVEIEKFERKKFRKNDVFQVSPRFTPPHSNTKSTIAMPQYAMTPGTVTRPSVHHRQSSVEQARTIMVVVIGVVLAETGMD